MELSGQERQRLVDANVPFVRSIASKVREQLPREIEIDDLFGYGMQGLLEAAGRYDRRHGVTFQTFAYYRVRGAMFDGLRTMGWLPRHQYRQQRFEERAAAYLGNLAERQAGLGDRAAGDATLEEEVQQLSEALGGVAAIFVTTMEEAHEPADTAAGEPALAHAAIERHQRDGAVAKALAALPPKERQLLQLYYFEDRPLEEAGRLMGLSKSWASRLHARAVGLLRDALSSHAALDATAADDPVRPRARR